MRASNATDADNEIQMRDNEHKYKKGTKVTKQLTEQKKNQRG